MHTLKRVDVEHRILPLKVLRLERFLYRISLRIVRCNHPILPILDFVLPRYQNRSSDFFSILNSCSVSDQSKSFVQLTIQLVPPGGFDSRPY